MAGFLVCGEQEIAAYFAAWHQKLSPKFIGLIRLLFWHQRKFRTLPKLLHVVRVGEMGVQWVPLLESKGDSG